MSKYERLARLMKITTLIRSHSSLNRGDLARKCEVSVRTIQRDVNTLCYAGVPIFWAERGYQIMPGYFLPPLNLDMEEASCLVAAARAFSEGKEALQREKIESAISKVLAALPDETRCRLK